jgi:hypothetical protein
LRVASTSCRRTPTCAATRNLGKVQLAAAGGTPHAPTAATLVVGDGVLFAAESVDVTAQVIAALKARTPAAPAAAPPKN